MRASKLACLKSEVIINSRYKLARFIDYVKVSPWAWRL